MSNLSPHPIGGKRRPLGNVGVVGRKPESVRSLGENLQFKGDPGVAQMIAQTISIIAFNISFSDCEISIQMGAFQNPHHRVVDGWIPAIGYFLR